MESKNILIKSGLLCIKLTKDYYSHNKFLLDRLEQDESNSQKVKFKRREMKNNLEIGAFILDTTGKRYYRIYQLDDCDSYSLHCIIDSTTGIVFKPKSDGYPNKGISWNIDECIRVADCGGNYLNLDPV